VETALVCELDEVMPRYAFIQFGTNEALYAPQMEMAPTDLEAIRTNLGEIIQTVRSYGAVPVILTAPVAMDSSLWVTGVPDRIIAINQVIRDTAEALREPLIDLWLAQQKEIGPTGGYGLDQSGVHLASPATADRWEGTVNLSPKNRHRYGMNLRSYLILSALDRLDRIRSNRSRRSTGRAR